jgi:hypothetical protein
MCDAELHFLKADVIITPVDNFQFNHYDKKIYDREYS